MRLRRFTASLLLVLPALAAEPGMVFIPGGTFPRGRSHALPDDDLKWYPTVLKDDRPVRPIRVDPFYLDRHEVTNAEYARFLQATRRPGPFHWPNGRVPEGRESDPIVNVTWDEAAAYAKWAGKRLPTEAEWERACRGLGEGRMYPWGDGAPDKSKARYDAVDGPAAVGCCGANTFGLFDMAGNVWEWVSDWYEKDYYAAAPEANPRGPAQGRYRILRGGSWADPAKHLTCAFRAWARPAERSPNVGFRCARDFR